MYAMMRLVGRQTRWTTLCVFDKCLLLSGLSTCEATTKAALALCASLVTEAVETAAVGFAHIVPHGGVSPLAAKTQDSSRIRLRQRS